MSRFRKIFVLLLGVFCCSCSTKLRNKKKFVLVRPFVEKPSVNFTVKPTKKLVERLTGIDQEIPNPFFFQPTIPVTYGVSFGYKWLGLSLAQASSLSRKELEEKGKTDFDDYQLHFNFTHFGMDLIYQKYTGFYTDESAGTHLLTNQLFPATTFERRAVNLFYIFTPKKFSLSAAFDQTSYLSKNGFSILAMSSIEEIKIHKIPYILTDETDPESGYHFAQFDTYGLQFGPTFTVWAGDVFLTLASLAGLAYQEQKVQQLSTDAQEKNFAPTLKAHGRVAAGYDSGGMFFVGSAIADYTEIPTEDYDVRFVSGLMKLAFGRRF